MKVSVKMDSLSLLNRSENILKQIYEVNGHPSVKLVKPQYYTHEMGAFYEM